MEASIAIRTVLSILHFGDIPTCITGEISSIKLL